ncbi:hypothetical protein [Methyloglobulus sp.]|uniref:hypothetical protein n=1 Tax=Methyloglobulus sp. TaxID=2518622 RepID=UPI0032B778EC
MAKNKKKTFHWAITALMLFIIGNLGTVSANLMPSETLALIKSTCPSDPSQRKELIQLRNQITAATTLNEARKLALSPTDDAINALKNAENIMPFSDDLKTAETRLSDARSRIMLASSQEQVADEFDGMMLAGLDNDRAAHVNIGSGGCDYSTGELIAIVVGLILGIIPGIILLVVLC